MVAPKQKILILRPCSRKINWNWLILIIHSVVYTSFLCLDFQPRPPEVNCSVYISHSFLFSSRHVLQKWTAETAVGHCSQMCYGIANYCSLKTLLEPSKLFNFLLFYITFEGLFSLTNARILMNLGSQFVHASSQSLIFLSLNVTGVPSLTLHLIRMFTGFWCLTWLLSNGNLIYSPSSYFLLLLRLHSHQAFACDSPKRGIGGAHLVTGHTQKHLPCGHPQSCRLVGYISCKGGNHVEK